VIHNLGNADLMLDQGEIREPGPRPTGLSTTGRLVLMIGRFEEWKGQHVFVDAVGHLPDELRSAHVFAMIGGSAPGKEAYYERVTAEANALGIQVLGQRDDIPELLRAADVSVHCSTTPDPFPGVVIESLLAGAATVAAAAGGVPEIITEDSMGILTPPGDAARLAETLRSLLTSETPPRQEYARNGRARALTLVDPDRIDRQVAELYRSVERAGRRGPGSSFAGGSDQGT
jgi:glycosyltransferase involved in cell wall biosynthesis